MDAGDLVDGDDRAAEGRAVRLDDRRVLARAALQRVRGELPGDRLAVAADAVGAVRRDDVGAAAAGDGLPPSVLRDDPVGPRGAADRGRPGRGREGEEDEHRHDPAPHPATTVAVTIVPA